MKKRILIPAVIGIAACAVFIGCHSDKPKETQTTLIDEVDGPQFPVDTQASAVETTAPVTTEAPATEAPSTAPEIIDITVEAGQTGRPDLANVKLEAKDTEYAENNIKVTYPQIVGLGDIAAQDFANQTLYKHMKSVVDHYVKDAENDKLTITYETLTLYRGQYSVLYKGTYQSGSDEPIHIAFTDNLNLITSTNIRLSSRISKDSLKRSIYEVKDYTITDGYAIKDSYVVSYLEGEPEDFYDSLVQNADFGGSDYPDAFSYSNGEEIRIIINVPHLLGDYVELSLVRKTK
jgi:hypothetical protein